MIQVALSFLILYLLSVAGCSDDPSGLGGSCGGDGDCAGSLICLADLPGGLCSRACEDDCPDDSECIDLAGESYCLPTCNSTSDCRDGFACSMGHCDLPCEDDEECPVYAFCDSDSDGCSLTTELSIGEACLIDSQCESELCMAVDGESGICSDTCGGREHCEGGSVCGLAVIDEAPAPRCIPAQGAASAGDLCSSGNDCASGMCARGSCTYPCGASGICESGATCQVGDVDILGESFVAEFCEPPTAPGVRAEDLGWFTTDRGVVHVEFDVPEDTASYAVVAWTEERVLIQARNLIGPGDGVFIGESGGGFIRVYDQEWVQTVMVPNTDRDGGQVRPGQHSIEFHAHDPEGDLLMDARIYVRVLYKIRDGAVCDEGEMVLNIHIAPHVYGPLSATTAEVSPWIQEILDRIRFFYEMTCDVRLGEVRYLDLDSRFSFIGTEEELREMLVETTPGTLRASANVFFVRDLTGVSEWLAGISGGLPGPPGLLGTIRSGVAVSAQESAQATGDVMAHELGHFFGLFHPTERNGFTQDPIDDTDTCTFDPDDFWEMMRCRTYWNIMFPLATGEADEISDGQCFVVRNHQAL